MSGTATLPLWRRIADELRERIDSGHYGDHFPGELAVAKEFSVSRGTARAALRPLRESGLISSARGRRSKIAQVDPASRFGAIYSLHELITESGMDHTSRVIEQRTIPAADAPEAASRLGVGETGELFHLERLRLADGEPFAHDEIFAPASVAAPLVEVDFTDAAFYEQLRDTCGVVIDGGTEQTSARSAGSELAERLRCSPETALLCVERLAASQGRTVEWRRTVFLGDRFSTVRPFGEAAIGHPLRETS